MKTTIALALAACTLIGSMACAARAEEHNTAEQRKATQCMIQMFKQSKAANHGTAIEADVVKRYDYACAFVWIDYRDQAGADSATSVVGGLLQYMLAHPNEY